VGISVIGVVAGVIGRGWYTEKYQPVRDSEETEIRILEDEGAPSEESEVLILEDAGAPSEESEVLIIEDVEAANEEAEPQIPGDEGVPSEETKPKIIGEVSAQEAFVLIQQNQDNPDFVILDVRKPENFADGHIEGAINIYKHSRNFEEELQKLDKGKTYLVYCRKCTPPYPCSINPPGAAAVMRNLNFEKVYNMGGIIQWQEEEYPLVK
jgi:rhodanese-related sulfurtransferase